MFLRNDAAIDERFCVFVRLGRRFRSFGEKRFGNRPCLSLSLRVVNLQVTSPGKKLRPRFRTGLRGTSLGLIASSTMGNLKACLSTRMVQDDSGCKVARVSEIPNMTQVLAACPWLNAHVEAAVAGCL